MVKYANNESKIRISNTLIIGNLWEHPYKNTMQPIKYLERMEEKNGFLDLKNKRFLVFLRIMKVILVDGKKTRTYRKA